MNILETILQAGGGGVVDSLGKQLGIGKTETGAILDNLIPALTRGLKQNTEQPDGLDSLLGALRSGNHERYLDDPSVLSNEDSVADGNGILGHILGNKDVSRELARRTSGKVGVSDSIIKKMLPMVGALVMGAMSKRNTQVGLGRDSAAPASGGGDLLAAFLDADKDGSILDDVLGMAGKFLGR